MKSALLVSSVTALLAFSVLTYAVCESVVPAKRVAGGNYSACTDDVCQEGSCSAGGTKTCVAGVNFNCIKKTYVTSSTPTPILDKAAGTNCSG